MHNHNLFEHGGGPAKETENPDIQLGAISLSLIIIKILISYYC